MKKMIINIVMVVLCLVALYINLYMGGYKALGAACIVAMGVLALMKEKIIDDQTGNNQFQSV